MAGGLGGRGFGAGVGAAGRRGVGDLHADGGSRMTVGGLIEYVAREQMHAAAAEEETASV